MSTALLCLFNVLLKTYELKFMKNNQINLFLAIIRINKFTLSCNLSLIPIFIQPKTELQLSKQKLLIFLTKEPLLSTFAGD